MKDQYFGDVNDYRKYGLLRVLQSTTGFRLLVAWMLTLDDGSRDGGFRAYLQESNRWASYDSGLYHGLAGLLDDATRPSVALLEESMLLPGSSFYSALVPDKRAEREKWHAGLIRAASGHDIVFLDPDNGIEVPSKPIGRKGSSKYVAWHEIQALWATGSSVLVYQHFPRRPRQAFIDRIAVEMRSRTGASWVEAFRTSHVLFLLAAQEKHRPRLEEALPTVATRWGDQVERVGLANQSIQPTPSFARGG